MPGDPSPDIGALRAVDTAKRREAISLARTGRVFDLGLEINENMPTGDRESFVPFSRAFSVTPEFSSPNEPYQFAAEFIVAALHTSTHIDAFVHVQTRGQTYGGHHGSDIRTDRGFTLHGIETVPPIVTRGIVLDVAGLRGVDALPDGEQITPDEIQRTLDDHGLAIRSGDAVLVRTGKERDYSVRPETYHQTEPGVGPDAARWMQAQGMVLLGTDTAGTEATPFPNPEDTTHKAMLIDAGVHLVENLALAEVAGAAVREGLFICLPLRITGATGSWVRPVLVT